MTHLHATSDEPGNEDDITAAAAWVIRLEADDASAEDRASFEQWLQQSPHHPAQYARAQRRHLLALALADDDVLRAELRRARSAPPKRTAWRWPAGIAAALAVLLVPLLVLQPWRPTVEHFATAVGERRDIVLDDGSRLVLDTDSEISVRFSRSERQLQVLRGQAQFVVGKDPGRPFVVTAGNVWIRDIGTTFQVRRTATVLDVALLEGAVDIGLQGERTPRASLVPGQQAQVDDRGGIRVGNADTPALQAWTQGALLIDHQRLDQVLAEMNRYSAQQMRLADPADGALIISGRFNTQDQPAFLAALQTGWSLTATAEGNNEVVLRRRH